VNYVDPLGLCTSTDARLVVTDDTINYSAFEDQELEIVYYDDWQSSITVEFGGKKHTVGDNLDIGDTVPFNSEFNVPEGTTLEIEGENIGFAMSSAGRLTLPKAIDEYNEIVSTEAYQKAIRRDKAIGMGEMVLGGTIAFGSIAVIGTNPEMAPAAAISYATTMKIGMSLFAHGLSRTMGANKQQIVTDIRNSTLPTSYFGGF